MTDSGVNLTDTALEILNTNHTATLATHGLKHEGYPFTSLMPYAVVDSRPFFFISSMATHTKNLRADSRSSLFVAVAEREAGLAEGRLTLIGDVRPVESTGQLKTSYLRKHPRAEQWIDFGDFQFYQMELVEAYVVAGFGAMGWTKLE